MRSFRIINPLVKSKKGKAACLVLGLLLVVLTTAYAYTQSVSKYPTGYVLGTTDMGNSMTLEKGSVFGFNSAKSANDTEAYSTIQEGACSTPATLFDFTEGREGFTSTTVTAITYGYSGVEGKTAGGSLQTRLSTTQTTARTYTWSKSFLWDCGTPLGTVPVSVWYRRGTTWANQGVTANLAVTLVKPDLNTVNLIAPTSILGAADSAWIQLSAADVAANFNQIGVYTLRLTGTLQGAGTGTNMYLFLDDFNLNLNSNFASYTQDVEFTERAVPSSASGAYLLDIKARKITGDTETTNIQVCGDNLPTCGSWVTRYSVTSAHTGPSWYLFNTYTLSTAEYNNGNVRIRYVDATPTADSNRGGIDVEYQRITVDQGTCVDTVTDSESDCGKCHNYGGDVSKPWPSTGMHNKHAQSESISDCLWCHPNAGVDSGHSNGVLTVAGTKLYRAADGNLNGAPGTALYDGTAKTCSGIACHMNLVTPRWDATYGLTQASLNGTTVIARNCSRCHNSGTPGTDKYSGSPTIYGPLDADWNMNVSWPVDAGGGHTSHNTAVAFDTYSCQSNGSCHPDNRGQHSVVDDGNVLVMMAPNYGSPNAVIKYIKSSATKGDGICVNVSCHGGQATPKFNASSTNPINMTLTTGVTCIKCHVAEQATGWGTAPGNASQYNSAISGLHRGSPPTSGQDHASGLTNGCQACHTLASLTLHFKTAGGVTNLDSWQMDSMQGAVFVAANGYVTGTGTAPNYTTPPTCAVTTATCHAEGNTTFRNPATTWKRRWSWDSYAAETPDIEKVKQCNGCHGHWGTFVTNVVEPHVMSNSDGTLRTNLETKHTDSGVNCGTMCHAQGATLPSAYNHGVIVGATTKDMSLNNNATPVDNGTTVGCSNACHANDPGVPDGGGTGSHVFADAPWQVTVNHTNGPTVTCYTCHGGGTAQTGGAGFNYWPDGVTYPDLAGGSAPKSRHLLHIEKLAAKLTYTMGTLTDVQQKAMCLYCHGTLPGGAGGHNADVVTGGANQAEVTLIRRIWNNTADATAPAFSFSAADGSCTGIDCHNNVATTATYTWRSNGTSTCIMCHTPHGTGGPTTGLHNITVAGPQHHDNGLSGGCTACHSATPPATHINGTFTADAASNTLAERFIGGTTAFTYTETALTLGRSGTCSGAGLAACHSDGGNWTRLWSTEANSTATATSSQRCNVCHGQWSTIANSTGWAAGSTHYKAGGLNVATNSRGKGHDDNSCNNCHLYGASGNARHNVLTRQLNLNSNGATPGRTGAVYGTSTAGCGACHGTQADVNYNFPISYFPVLNVGTGTAFIAPTCISCHAGGDNITTPLVSGTSSHVKANGITFGACEDCHAKHADATAAGSNVIYVSTVYTGTTAVPTMTKSDGTTALYGSGAHGYRIRLGGTVQNGGAKTTEAEWCWGCHDFLGSAVLQAKTITFTATTIVDSGAGFVTAGFVANKPVKISGSSVAANNKWATPTTVVAGTMTFPAATFTADATAGEVVTLQNNVSEWRTNSSTATGSSAYDYGDLYTDVTAIPGTRTSNWTTGFWRSGKGLNSTLTTNPYWYKRGKVRSTHSASYDGTTAANDTGKPWKGTLTNNTGGYTTTFNKNETLDAVANIRCSYCHDVHNNHNGIKGDPAQSSPYLRGSWRGNAYAEDGAPRYGMANWTQQSDSTNAALLAFGAVPRASASTANTGITAVAQVGGFWIDQNSNNPTSLITGATALDKANNSAGLCEQCHGANKNGTWTAAALGTIDQITGEAAWVSGYNGHANSVLGAVGPGAAAGAENRARNIFTRTKRGSAVWSNAASNKATVDMGLATNGTARGYSYRSSYSTSTGYSWGPCVAGGTLNEEPFSFSFFAWNNVDYNSGSTRNSIHTGMKLLPTNLPAVASETAHDSQANYHTFTCSKCHNPHASRLPKLMITNCLDTNHNTWEDNNTFTGRALPTPWTGMRHSQWASAQNCHRLDARATGVTSTTTLGTGWTTVTPWIEDTAPNPASGAGKTADITTQLVY